MPRRGRLPAWCSARDGARALATPQSWFSVSPKTDQNSFVSYYSQYISSVCVMGSSAGILAGLARAKGSVLKNNRALAAAVP